MAACTCNVTRRHILNESVMIGPVVFVREKGVSVALLLVGNGSSME